MRFWIRAVLLVFAGVVASLYALCALSLFFLKFVNPWTTAVQIERRLDAIAHARPYQKRYHFVPLARISTDLQHAVIAAEDERFREHGGIDWIELKKVVEQDLERGKVTRGASTITQQLVKNLYLSTNRSTIRKGIEFTLVPLAEFTLGKDRILELYLNVIEWGPGIYGAEAASQSYYKIPAWRVGREQAARLAACVPAPLKRRPTMMTNYAEIIQTRMRQMGW
jgi:monofunctional biosynthetic peptidoglycan transglycosylase